MKSATNTQKQCVLEHPVLDTYTASRLLRSDGATLAGVTVAVVAPLLFLAGGTAAEVVGAARGKRCMQKSYLTALQGSLPRRNVHPALAPGLHIVCVGNVVSLRECLLIHG